jgi:AraC-like DNA-binding protein
MSTSTFCKNSTRLSAAPSPNTLARIRVEAAKKMLLNPNARVSEVAFDAGFQSITHFNRVFKNLVGQAPTEYRVGAAESRRSRVPEAAKSGEQCARARSVRGTGTKVSHEPSCDHD